jgi:hypothetical protein
METIMQEHRRKTELARFGETVALEHLTKIGHECTFLGDYFRCFDIEANKNGNKYLVSVKTRNHTTHNNDEKRDCYNLFFNKKKGEADVNAEVTIATAIARNRNAVPMWVAVRVDVVGQRYSIYWGLVADLKNKKCIPMSPSDRSKYKKLAEDVFDARIDAKWWNVKARRSTRGPSMVVAAKAVLSRPSYGR